jgi:hypothetical protein
LYDDDDDDDDDDVAYNLAGMNADRIFVIDEVRVSGKGTSYTVL